MDATQVAELIKTRRSVRRYSGGQVSDDQVAAILEAGRWAPSGLNNQPWRFAVVRDEGLKDAIGQQTRYTKVVQGAELLIAVFIHTPSMYHEVKDYQSMGACLQNMLLMVHGLGLGAVWLGEILKNADQVREILGLDDELELMAVLAVCRPGDAKAASSRKPLADLMLPVEPTA